MKKLDLEEKHKNTHKKSTNKQKSQSKQTIKRFGYPEKLAFLKELL